MNKIVLSLATLFLVACPAFAQVTVNGSGSAFASHDAAEISVQAATRDIYAAKANTMNKTVTDALFSIFESRKIDKKDRQTVGFSLDPVFNYTQNQEPKIMGYAVHHDISVTVRNLNQVGDFIDDVIKAGAMVRSVSFKVCDTTSMMKTARDHAMADAKAKATQLAKDAGASLGKVISIQESWYNPRPVAYAARQSADAAPGGTQVATGQHQISCNVTVVWELKQGSEHHHHE